MSGAVCPECAQGKHANCTRQALDPVTDEIVACQCATRGHESAAHQR